MKKILLSVFALFVPVVFLSAQSDEINNYIEVMGVASKTVTPDRITLSITVSERDSRNTSLSVLERNMKSSLSDVGIDIEKNLKVADMSSVYRRQGSHSQDAVLSKNYTLQLRDASIACKVLAVLEETGISNVYVTKKEYSAIDSLKLAVKAESVANALTTARAMVSALGQELGPAFFIQEHNVWSEDNNYSNTSRRLYGMSYSKDENVEEMAELSFDGIKVSSTVTVRFRLP